ncbi:MAG TPA: FmdB family zinc ribbon protein [Anaeromyxobacteraceae bacterium]|jgi:putative FmdB family regulatory protein|nr:FmdB family zinc ribbon protein [Anaeromyxobacteraceae bacterium]
MPIYEYDCPQCGRFEALQKMSAKPLKTHESCGSKVTKVMSASSFAFKGSGFYQTDYKKQSTSSCGSASPKNEACASCPGSKGGKAA